MKAEIKERLKEAGLTENEAKAYLALLEAGPSHAGLISRRSGLHRRVVYDAIEMLIKKGLVGYILRNNVKLFQASSPSRFLEILKEKENLIQEVMPEMLEFYNQSKEKEETLFFKGKNGLKTVFEDQLKEAEKTKEILIVDTSHLAYEMFDIYFHWFDKRRQEKKIKAKIIFNIEEKKLKPKIPLAEIRYLSSKYATPAAINIYGDKTAIIHWSKENPFAIVIKNQEISRGYRKYFELMWNSAKAC